MATRDELEALRVLVQYVSRAFYEPKFVVILDQLARHPVLKDEELAGRIGLQAKELNKLMAVLTNDRLVHIYRQNELRDGTQRSVGRQYYFIDYQNFCNVVKWRVTEMRRIIDSTLRNELDNKGYICPNCKATYSPLEADRLLDTDRGTLVCDICRTSPGGPYEVIENEDEEAVRGSKDRMERFNKQTRFIREGLRKSEEMTLPAFDVVQWVKANTVEDKQKHNQNGGLRIAGADGKHQEQNIGVVLSVDKDEATRRREREEEAEMKRQQNALPTWHLKSTISNDLTALGVAAQKAKMSANEAILSSLGKPGPSNTDMLNGLGKTTPQVKVEQTEAAIVEEKKPEIDHTADFYEQYYASLEAASQAQSSAPTPRSLLGDFEQEEQKPDIAYLDALNASGKRSRSPDDVSFRENKALRSNTGTPVFSRSGSTTGALSNALENSAPFAGSSQETIDATMDISDTPAEEPPLGEPMVLVGGQPMPFSQVTQDIADEKMTPEEYTAWYELMMAEG